MKKLWRIVALVLAICTVLPCLAHIPIQTQAVVTDSGTCGDNPTWSLEMSHLTITGTGDMYDYSPTNPAPWKKYTPSNVLIDEGVTCIGAYAFYYQKDLRYVSCAATVKQIKEQAFNKNIANDNLIYFGFVDGNIEIASDAFKNIKFGVYTVFNPEPWQNPPSYGGKFMWHYSHDLKLSSDTKNTYAPNEPIKPEDFRFYADLSEDVSYTPKNIEIGPYNNSTSGQKTVSVTADGITLYHTYMVTDGTSHLDKLVVKFPNYVEFNRTFSTPKPLIYDGDILLIEGTDYYISYSNDINITDSATATIKGKGLYAGYEKTFTYAIIRRDVSNHRLSVPYKTYIAAPITPDDISFYGVNLEGHSSEAPHVDYTAYAEQNVNVGKGFVRAVCTGNDYGAPTGEFEIKLGSELIYMPGYYMGQYDGVLDEQTMVSEIWLTPGEFTGRVESSNRNMAYYELYKLVGEELSLVTTYTSDVGFDSSTSFKYDFSSDYNNTPSDFTTYALTYVWQDENGGVYSGTMIIHIIHQIGTASTMQLEQVANDEDFRHDYLTVYSEDGVLEKSVWSISDSSVATVDRGAVTFLKPGTVTVTVTCGKLIAQQTLTAEAIPMADTTILAWEDGKAALMYDYILLKEGIDFTATAQTANGVITVTAEGKGLFEGTVTRRFDAATGQPLGSTKPVLPGIPGDINDDTAVNNDDVALLLWHTLFPEDYPIDTNGDITGDGETNNEDVALLLWHTLFPEDYPL